VQLALYLVLPCDFRCFGFNCLLLVIGANWSFKGDHSLCSDNFDIVSVSGE
jgi:hypothetical protein